MCPLKSHHHSSCESVQRLIFACSGAADVGHIADLAARQLSEAGFGEMSCLAAVNGQIPAAVDKARSAKQILAIDGCSEDCARKSLEAAGIEHFDHVRITDLGMQKGDSPAGYQRVASVLHHITGNLRR